MRRLPLLICLLAAAGALHADTMQVVLQRGLAGYAGVADTYLYAPSVVANINFGRSVQLPAGRNRWGELYVSLIRFDLSELPPPTRVKSASLWLYATSNDFPIRRLTVEAQAIAPADAGWTEGSGTGTRTPIPGTACWNYRSYRAAAWAGAPGLTKAGVDYETTPLGTAVVKPGEVGWVEIKLSPQAVTRWIAHPASNTGLRLFPQSAQNKGEIAYFASSDLTTDPSQRPKLVLQVAMDPATAATYRRTRAFRQEAELAQALATETAAFKAAGSPARAATELGLLRRRVAAMREQAAAARFSTDLELQDYVADCQRWQRRLDEFPAEIVLAQAAADDTSRGLKTDFALVAADSMTNVLREPQYLEGKFQPTAHVELAQNEFEAVQAVIVPIDADVTRASWQVTPLRGPGTAVLPATEIKVSVVGYQATRKPALPTTVKWWPGPILDFMKTVDVKRGYVQPLWVCIHTREDTPPGEYHGSLTVQATGCQPKRLDLRVRVYGFAVPREQHLLTVWGNNEATYRRLYGKRYNKQMAHAMFKFLLDHRLAVNTLYAAQAAGKPIGPGFYTDCIGYPTLSDPAELRRLWEAGSRWWNLGYLCTSHARRAGLPFDQYVPKFIEMMRSSLKVADAAGWPHSNLGIYFFDETSDFATLNRAAAQVKAAFPDIPLMTTGRDRSYGVKNGPIDKSIDIWCPLSPVYRQDVSVIEQGRNAGKRVWWYVCCGPRGAHDLNFFTEFPAIRSRLLMGTAAWKYQPDGFLYYRISGWSRYDKPLDKGPLTDWQPYYLPGPDGDGELICPGPNGPLSTLQFENLRDGIEDYEYYWKLRDLVRRAREQGIDADRAAGLLQVPPDLLTSLTSYSENPAVLRHQRREVAEAIVNLQDKVQ